MNRNVNSVISHRARRLFQQFQLRPLEIRGKLLIDALMIGAHSLRWQYKQEIPETKLEEGMIVSDEPGMYVQDSHGILIKMQGLILMRQLSQNLR